MARLTSRQTSELQLWARNYVRSGYQMIDEIEEQLVEMLGEFKSRLTEREIREEAHTALSAAIQSLVQEQKTWPSLTDNDRLDLAFEQLDDAGIIARQNFSCCSSCASDEITFEILDYDESRRPIRGFVYFHQRDTISAVESGKIYLSFGSVAAQGDEQCVPLDVIGREIHERLSAVGLDAWWSGKTHHRIGVNINWQRRWVVPAARPFRRLPF